MTDSQKALKKAIDKCEARYGSYLLDGANRKKVSHKMRDLEDHTYLVLIVSEIIPQCELDNSRRTLRSGDSSEIILIRDIESRRRKKVTVRKIVRFCSKC